MADIKKEEIRTQGEASEILHGHSNSNQGMGRTASTVGTFLINAKVIEEK